jgi:hypothetical protein
MKRSAGSVFVLVCIVVVAAGLTLPAGVSGGPVAGSTGISSQDLSPAAPAGPAGEENARVQMEALPLTFLPNRGQYDPAVSFMVAGPESALFFTQDGIVITAEETGSAGSVSHVVRQTFPGSSTPAVITGSDPLPGTANFFYGNDPSLWRSNVPTYGAVVYHDLYPGIDLRYQGTGRVLKREFVVAPGSDPSVIRLHYEGIDRISVDESGSLVITAGGSTLTESPVICYQESDGIRSRVPAGYTTAGEKDVVFTLGEYDPSSPLVIDPALVYSTFIGSTADDVGNSIALDSGGNAYITGYTRSGEFPTTPGAFNRTYNGDTYDAFVVKMNAEGSSLVYSTFLGGESSDFSKALVVDSSGNAYLTGGTYSVLFPTTVGAYNRTHGGLGDVFVTKINPAGSSLVYSTYIGNAGDDAAYAIALDGSGNAYVTGSTSSGTYPTKPGAFNRTFAGARDAFVTKLNSGGTDLLYSTFLGGVDWDEGMGIVLNSNNKAYVTGNTQSYDFPTSIGAFNRTRGGSYDAFITQLNDGGTDIIYSTFLGGADSDNGRAIALDGSNNAYVTGTTYSYDFPTSIGAFNRTRGGSYDAYVAKLNAAGSSLVYSTFLGGSGSDAGTSILSDTSGNAYVAGYTQSFDFPTTAGAFNRTFGGNYDVILVKLNATGKGLAYGTFLGGAGEEQGNDLARDSSGNVYVTGYTYSAAYPTTTGAWNRTYSSAMDVFVTKFMPIASAGIGVVRNNKTWLLDASRDGKYGTGDLTCTFGKAGDVPVTGIWTGTTGTRIGVVRNNKTWLLDASGNGAFGAGDLTYTFGKAGDVPVTGDWDHDGMTEIGVVRSGKTWLLDASGDGAFGAGDFTYMFGKAGDVPVTGDWDGDGMTEIGVVRSNTSWLLDASGDGAFGAGDYTYTFGKAGDVPVTGDWNNNRKTEIGVVRGNTTWLLDTSGNGAFGSGDFTYTFGKNGDKPVTGVW